MKKIVLIALSAFFAAQPAFAYEHQRVLDNFAEDVSECVAYYTITVIDAKKNALNDPQWEQIAMDYKQTLTNSITLLRTAMNGKPEKFIESKIDLRMQEQTTILEQEGIDRLMFLHAKSCKEIMENPMKRIRYWEDKQ